MISIFPKKTAYSKIIVAYSYDTRWVMEIYIGDGKSETIGPTGSYLGLLEFKLDNVNENDISYIIVKYRPHFIILRMALFSTAIYLGLAGFMIVYKQKDD